MWLSNTSQAGSLRHRLKRPLLIPLSAWKQERDFLAESWHRLAGGLGRDDVALLRRRPFRRASGESSGPNAPGTKGKKNSRIKRWDIVTIGNLSRNRYWGESDARAVRSAICTCTLITGEGLSVVIAGDAVATRDFWNERRSYFNAVDPEVAARTMDRIASMADIVVPGHDNYFLVSPLT